MKDILFVIFAILLGVGLVVGFNRLDQLESRMTRLDAALQSPEDAAADPHRPEVAVTTATQQAEARDPVVQPAPTTPNPPTQNPSQPTPAKSALDELMRDL